MPVLKCSNQLLQQKLVGRVYLVTGGNAGIGLETVKQLAKQGATVIFTARQIAVGKSIADGINSGLTMGNKVEAMYLDLSDLNTVKSFAEEFKKKHQVLHVLINNAGIMNVPKLERTSAGHELQFATNHLGHFLLTNLLLDLLKTSAPSRIVNVSSCYHHIAMGKKGYIDFDDINFDKRPYNGWTSYAQSKLANVLHARELAKRLQGTGVTAVSLHPGWVRTNLIKNTIPVWLQNTICIPFFRSGGMIEPWDGMQTTLFCAIDDSVPSHTGEFYSQDGNYGGKHMSGWPMPSPNQEVTDSNAARLWQESERMCGGGGGQPIIVSPSK